MRYVLLKPSRCSASFISLIAFSDVSASKWQFVPTICAPFIHTHKLCQSRNATRQDVPPYRWMLNRKEMHQIRLKVLQYYRPTAYKVCIHFPHRTQEISLSYKHKWSFSCWSLLRRIDKTEYYELFTTRLRWFRCFKFTKCLKAASKKC